MIQATIFHLDFINFKHNFLHQIPATEISNEVYSLASLSICWLFHNPFTTGSSYNVICQMECKQWILNDDELSGCGLLQSKIREFPEEAEENHKNAHSGWLVPGPRREPGTCQMKHKDCPLNCNVRDPCYYLHQSVNSSQNQAVGAAWRQRQWNVSIQRYTQKIS